MKPNVKITIFSLIITTILIMLLPPVLSIKNQSIIDTEPIPEHALFTSEINDSPVEKYFITRHFSYNALITKTNKWNESKTMINDSDSVDFIDYIQLAKTCHGLFIPDDAEIIVEIQNDKIVVIFNPNPEWVKTQKPYPGLDDHYVEVVIDIKNKSILEILPSPN